VSLPARLPAMIAAALGATILSPAAVAAAEEESHLSRNAVEIARPFGFPITNSMVVSWVVALGLIVFARVATRDMKRVPEGAQNFLEWLVSGLYGLLEGIIGPHLVKRTFWFFATIFIFILTANWVSLIPGVGTIGWGHRSDAGFKIDQPLLRGANAGLMVVVFFAAGLPGRWPGWSPQGAKRLSTRLVQDSRPDGLTAQIDELRKSHSFNRLVGAGGGNRTHTRGDPLGILSPARLPVSPLRR
jgi:hypothetical protein